MSTDDSFNIIPNEIIYQIFNHLLQKQVLGVLRVNLLWRFLGRDLLNRFLTKAYPFLITEGLTAAECVALLERQQNICVKLAEKYGLSLTCTKDDKNLTPEQHAFLKALAVASGLADDIEDQEKGLAFVLMAALGNTQKLKTWNESYGEKIFNVDKDEALWEAARNGQVACVKYLIETGGKEISDEDKGAALLEADRNGHVACVAYLTEACGQEILNDCKKWAFPKRGEDPQQSPEEDQSADVFYENLNNSLIFAYEADTNASVGTHEITRKEKYRRK